MKELQEDYNVKLTVMLSKEGAAVVKWYKMWLALTKAVENVKVEKTPNIPFYAGPLQLTNCVAQAIKGGQMVYIFPSDQDTEPIVTSRPDGTPLTLKIRDIELENIKKIKSMEGIVVISDFSEIKNLIIQKIKEKA
jgi:flavoprotein